MFKEYIKKDLNNVFKNIDEFSENVIINGVSVVINKDNDRLSQKAFGDVDGIVIGDVLFFITTDEFKKIPHMKKTPKSGDAFIFDGKPCTILTVAENSGMYEISVQFAGSGR